MEILEWVQCCFCIGGEEEEEETVARQSSRQITRELSRGIDIELANREVVEYEIPTKHDSPIRRRGYV